MDDGTKKSSYNSDPIGIVSSHQPTGHSWLMGVLCLKTTANSQDIYPKNILKQNKIYINI